MNGEDGKSRGAGLAALALSGGIWGSSFLFGKWILEDLGVSHMVLMRFALASIAFAPVFVLGRRTRKHITRSDWNIIVVSAVFGIPIQYLIQYEGLARTTVAHASLMVGALPVLLAAAAAIFMKERLTPLGWAGVVASVVGAALVATSSGSSGNGSATLAGDALVVLSTFASVVWVLTTKVLIDRGHDAAFVSAIVIVLGTVMLGVYVIATKGMVPFAAISMRNWTLLFILGVVCTMLTTLLWNWGLGRVPASVAGVFINLEPLVGTGLGYALLGDRIGPIGLLGGALIIGSTLVVARGGE